MRASEQVLVLPHQCGSVSVELDIRGAECRLVEGDDLGGKVERFGGTLDIGGAAPGRVAVIASEKGMAEAVERLGVLRERRDGR